MSHSARDLLVRGIAAAIGNSPDEARRDLPRNAVQQFLRGLFDN